MGSRLHYTKRKRIKIKRTLIINGINFVNVLKERCNRRNIT